MQQDYELPEPTDLGSASEQTLGATGRYFDLVGEIPETGIADD